MNALIHSTNIDFPQIFHHGAVDGVTGSCHRLQLSAEKACLVDCGLFQGAEGPRGDAIVRQRIDLGAVTLISHKIIQNGLHKLEAVSLPLISGNNLFVFVESAQWFYHERI